MQQQVVMPQNLNMAHFGQINPNVINSNDPSLLFLQHSQDSSSFSLPPYLPLHQIDMNPPASAPLHSQAFSFDGSDDANIENPNVISLETLKSMLPEDSDERPKAGLLPDGHAYAPGAHAKNQYLLFPSKAAYIAYYINYYFSEANLVRDNYIIGLMVEGSSLPIAKLLDFPRLLAVSATVQDIESAVANNKLLEITRITSVGLCVRRIDGLPNNMNRSDVMSAPPSVTMSPDSFSAVPLMNQPNGFEGHGFTGNQFPNQPMAVSTNNSNGQSMWSQGALMNPYANQTIPFVPNTPADIQSSIPGTTVASQMPPTATTPSGQVTWSNTGQVSVATTSPRAPVQAPGLPGAAQVLSQQSQPFITPGMAPQPYGNLILMNALSLGVPQSQCGQLRYIHPQASGAGSIVSSTPGSTQGDFYQATAAPGSTQQMQLTPHHPSLFLLNSSNMLFAHPTFAALSHQAQNPGHFSPAMQTAGVSQSQVIGPGHHQSLMGPPGILNLQQQQQVFAALQQQQQQQLVAMQQGFVAAAPNINHYTGGNHQMLQHATANNAPPPGLVQGSNHWPNNPVAMSQSHLFQTSLSQNVQPQIIAVHGASPPGMPPGKTGDNSTSGTPVPPVSTSVDTQNRVLTTGVSNLNINSGRSSSSGIASGISSQNSTSVVAVSGGSSSSVSSSSTTSGVDSMSGKHQYTTAIGKVAQKPEEVSVAKLGGSSGHPGGPGNVPSYNRGSNKQGYYRQKINTVGNYEENNNHGYVGSWRGHRGGPGIRGGRGYNYNNSGSLSHRHQGSFNQVTAGSNSSLSRTTSNESGMPSKRSDGAAETIPQPLAQEG